MNMLAELPPDHDLTHLTRSLNYVKQFRTAVDGGAHKGIWTKELLKHFDRVVSFEPVASNYQFLETINPDFSFNFALGKAPGLATMEAGSENTGQYFVQPGGDTAIVAIDEFEIPDVDFIKLDVEGFELFALQGAIETIEDYHPVILIEENGLCNRYGTPEGDAGRYLEANGYTMVKKMNKDYLYEFGASPTRD